MLLAFYNNDFSDNVGRILEGSLHAEVRNGAVQLVRPDPSRAASDWINKLKDWSYLFNLLAYCGDRFSDVRLRNAMVGRPQTPGGTKSPPAAISDKSPEVQVTRCYLGEVQESLAEKQAKLIVAFIPGQAELGEDDRSVTEDLSLPEQIGYRQAFFRCASQLGIETIDLLPRMLAAKKAAGPSA